MARIWQDAALASGICRRAATCALALSIVFVLLVVASAVAQAQSFKVLYQFKGGKDGARPASDLIVDTAGNLYGTTPWGGGTGCSSQVGCGIVFKISKAGKETVLYRFRGGNDGGGPVSSLLMDASGNLYGTTHEGGDSTNCGGWGCGTIFKLSKAGTETVLYRFGAGANGAGPDSPLIQDSAGNFYGTTTGGGDAYGGGTVWKLDKAGKLTVLKRFTGTDGDGPSGSLLRDAKGNIYGTTVSGGDLNCYYPWGCGVVFKLDAKGTETMYAFTGDPNHPTGDGLYPHAGVFQDAQGNIYGPTNEGGANDCGAFRPGTLFKWTPGGKETVLYSFKCSSDGAIPHGLLMDPGGKVFYGETYIGGDPACGFGCGTVYKIDKTGKGEQVLYNFSPGPGGMWPTGGLVRDAKGTLYGTTTAAGNVTSCTIPDGKGCGTVFAIVP